ncbi:MAG: toxin-antitoxin system HicB family antitoxin [Deltaproteobacteria bacterium]
MNIVDRYTYRVIWSEDDQEFVGLCAEFPSLSWLSAEREDALRGIVQLIRDTLADLDDTEEAPVPLNDRPYSGELRIRIPPAIHQRLAVEAAERGTSLNKIIVQKLS